MRARMRGVEFFEMAPQLPKDSQVISGVLERNFHNLYFPAACRSKIAREVFSLISAAFGVVKG